MIKSKAEERKLKLDAEQEDEKEKYRRFIERFECGALRTIFHTTMGVHWTNPSGLFDPSFEIPKELVEEEKKDPDDDDPEAAEAESNTDSAPSFNPNASTMSALTVDTNLKDVAGAKNEKKITITLPNQEQQTPPKTAPNHNQNSILRRRSSLPGASPKKMFGPQAVDEEVPPPPNEHWPGIKVHKRRVVKIDLHENNLMGSLPGGPGQGIFPQTTDIPPFGTTKTLLDELRVFIMFKNDLSGPIPASYSNFKVLQHLDLSYNRLTLLPEEIFSILTLKRIHLEKNYVMEGTIPAEIGDLKNLVSMTVQVSERSERALWKTSILAMKCAKWLQRATSTTKLNIIPLNSFGSLRLFRSCFIKNAPRFARRRTTR